MSRTFAVLSAAFLITLGSLSTIARADWPAKVFAPYASGGGRGGRGGAAAQGPLITCYNATGQKYFTLAFCNAGRDGNPSYGGTVTRENPPGLEQINAIRAKGGDVIMSFGGAGANELAIAETDPVKLQEKYQTVVDAYKLTWIDLDVEDKALANPEVISRRNIALAAVQKNTPGLRVVYTLSADPNRALPDFHVDGIGTPGLDALKDAKLKGLKVAAVNVMVMDYGDRFDAMIKQGKTMGDLAIYTANVAHKQTMEIDPDIKLGVCPMIGVNDDREEIFTTDDAKAVMDFAAKNDWMNLITFWVIGADSGARGRRGGGGGGGAAPATRAGAAPTATPWAYTDIFRTFTAGFNPATQP